MRKHRLAVIVGAFGFGSRTPRALTAEESALFSAVGRQVGIAVENAQFYQRERKQAQQMATTAERSRLARELHDSVTQSLYSVALFAQAGREAAASCCRLPLIAISPALLHR